MGRVGSDPQFHVNYGSGRVGSLHLWSCGSGWVGSRKLDPRPTLRLTSIKNVTMISNGSRQTNRQTHTHTHMHRQTLLKTTPPRYTIAERVVNIALRKKASAPASCSSLASSIQRTMIVSNRYRPSHSVYNS